jgi:hypothetical protein
LTKIEIRRGKNLSDDVTLEFEPEFFQAGNLTPGNGTRTVWSWKIMGGMAGIAGVAFGFPGRGRGISQRGKLFPG